MEEINWAPLSRPITINQLLRRMFEETSSKNDAFRTEQDRIGAEAIRRFVSKLAEDFDVTEQMIDDEFEDWWEMQAD